MNRRAVGTGLLLLAAVLTTVVAWQLRPQPKPRPPVRDRSDYTLRDFELTTLNDQGEESFTVVGPRLERDPEGKSLTLTKPRFSFPDDGGGRWQARSDRAWVAPKGKEVRLLQNVEMVGPKSAEGLQTRFNAERLDVFPDENRAQSEDRVTVTQADSILQGTGLRADMQANRIQLLADVKGRYAPRRD